MVRTAATARSLKFSKSYTRDALRRNFLRVLNSLGAVAALRWASGVFAPRFVNQFGGAQGNGPGCSVLARISRRVIGESKRHSVRMQALLAQREEECIGVG